MPRRSLQDVKSSRSAALASAVRIASVQGLEGLSIARLADGEGLSKSGLFGLFGSKLELQMRTLQAGAELFAAEVWAPVLEVPAGRARLLALCDRWLDFHERDVQPGGCFMTTAAVEWDARPGPQRDAVARVMRRWLRTLEGEVALAVDVGELPRELDPADTAFALNAIASAASWNYRLSGEREVLARAGRLMRDVLQPARTR